MQFTLETEPATLSDRLLEGLGGRGWMRRKNQKRDAPAARDPRARARVAAQRVTVAAG